MFLKVSHAAGDALDRVVRQVGPDVRRAEAVRVPRLHQPAGAGERVVNGLAAVVDAGEQVGVDVDTAGLKIHTSMEFWSRGGESREMGHSKAIVRHTAALPKCGPLLSDVIRKAADSAESCCSAPAATIA
jgi:hypothetical protein